MDVLVSPVDRFPPKGGLLPVERVEMALGGCASNTALALARIGVPVSLWGKIGKDRLGDLARQDLEREGVEVSGLLRDPASTTSATVVLVDSKAQRSFLHALAANDRTSLKDLRLSRLSRFDHLHIGGYFLFPRLDGAPMAKVLREAKRQGLTTSLDTAWDLKGRWMKALKPCLPHLDFLMPSEREVRKLLGHCDPSRAARTFLGLGVGHFILKRGGKGSLLFTRGGGQVQAPAFKTRVVDTTGAGDGFCAGFLKGLSLGWPLGDCLRLGNAAGACAVSELGATAGIRSFKQLERIL